MLEVNLNSTSPVLNFGTFSCPANLCSGIAKVHSIFPVGVVIKGLAAAIVVSEVYVVDEGVTNALTSTLSKKAYNMHLRQFHQKIHILLY